MHSHAPGDLPRRTSFIILHDVWGGLPQRPTPVQPAFHPPSLHRDRLELAVCSRLPCNALAMRERANTTDLLNFTVEIWGTQHYNQKQQARRRAEGRPTPCPTPTHTSPMPRHRHLARSVITCAATSPEANRGRRNGRGASTWDAGASHCQHACCPFPERPDLDKKDAHASYPAQWSGSRGGRLTTLYGRAEQNAHRTGRGTPSPAAEKCRHANPGQKPIGSRRIH